MVLTLSSNNDDITLYLKLLVLFNADDTVVLWNRFEGFLKQFRYVIRIIRRIMALKY